MWAEAARWLGKFNEAVLTSLDADGYPVSVRLNAHGYVAATGELPVTMPETLGAVAGPPICCATTTTKSCGTSTPSRSGDASKSVAAIGSS